MLTIGSGVLAFAALAIAWRELRPGGEVAYSQSWRDVIGLVATVGAIAALLAWLWLSL